jgi:hypothetical protein
MPRFYLHLCNGAEFAEDDDGIDLPDTATARARAVEGLRDVLAGDLQSGQLNTASFIEVEDEQRQLIATVLFEEAVALNATSAIRPPRQRVVAGSPGEHD